MRLLSTIVFGGMALAAATFASAAAAKADNVGVYAGRGGIAFHVNHYDDRYYRYGRRCVTRWDFRHKWYCRQRARYYYDDYNYRPYHRYYRDRYDYRPRYRHRSNRHWRHNRNYRR